MFPCLRRAPRRLAAGERDDRAALAADDDRAEAVEAEAPRVS